jgi:hypothetical protein
MKPFELGKFQGFESYEEIPVDIKEYVLTVAGFSGQPIEILPLWEINDFFMGLKDFERERVKAEWEDGWVL